MNAINTIRELIATLPLEAQPIGYAINEQLDRLPQPIAGGVSDEVVGALCWRARWAGSSTFGAWNDGPCSDEIVADMLAHGIEQVQRAYPPSQSIDDTVSGDMVMAAKKAALDVQPFMSENNGVRAWRLFKDDVNIGPVIDAMVRAALQSVWPGEKGVDLISVEPLATMIGQALIADGWDTDAAGDENLMESVRAAVQNGLSGIQRLAIKATQPPAGKEEAGVGREVGE